MIRWNLAAPKTPETTEDLLGISAEKLFLLMGIAGFIGIAWALRSPAGN